MTDMELRYPVALIKDSTAAFRQEGIHVAHEVKGPRVAHAFLTTEELLALLPSSAQPAAVSQTA